MHALFSGGQHDGHSLPGVQTGFSPSLQKPSCAKQLHVLSGVSWSEDPGQHESVHLQVGSLHSGQSFWQRDVVGSFFWTHTGELEHWTTSKASEMVSEITALAMASDDNARRSKSPC